MRFVTVTELRLRATEVIREIETTGEEVVVTKKGKPVVLMRVIEEGEFELKEVKHGKGKRQRDQK